MKARAKKRKRSVIQIRGEEFAISADLASALARIPELRRLKPKFAAPEFVRIYKRFQAELPFNVATLRSFSGLFDPSTSLREPGSWRSNLTYMEFDRLIRRQRRQS